MTESQQAKHDGLLCPVCRVDLVMSERQGIEIDYCPKCRGVWLDRGEIDKIIDRSVQETSGSQAGRSANAPAAASFIPQPAASLPWGASPPAPAYPPQPGHGHDSQGGYGSHGGGHGGGHGSHGGQHGGGHGRRGFLGRIFD